ncbi:SDR family NAD(P)-dependent oxidoreductase [Streptomyces sp. NPDC046821]|uniref:SDR family NAD(P)-dependent oxidoreductase n=1 Tax=Streptomyces sp. NPDC046821 TaxID=3154702 RepID=UPI0034031808
MGASLKGKVALVTGSSRGIGRAVAQRLAAEGATVVVTARSKAPMPSARAGQNQVVSGSLDETIEVIEAAGGRALSLTANLEDPGERDELIGRVVELAGGIDILVNNAGFADYARVEDMSFDTFDRTVDHYLRAPFALAKAAIPHMRARGAGWIVNIGSVTGVSPRRPFPDASLVRGGDVVYASTKAAVHRFSQGLAAELLGDKIAVNCVAPSTAISTPGAASLIPDGYETEPVEYLAQTVLEMCREPASERTGLVAFSLHYPWHHGLEVRSLDGRTVLPRREPPQFANPNINPSGL